MGPLTPSRQRRSGASNRVLRAKFPRGMFEDTKQGLFSVRVSPVENADQALFLIESPYRKWRLRRTVWCRKVPIVSSRVRADIMSSFCVAQSCQRESRRELRIGNTIWNSLYRSDNPYRTVLGVLRSTHGETLQYLFIEVHQVPSHHEWAAGYGNMRFLASQD